MMEQWEFRPDGVHPADPTIYKLKSRLKNVTIEILEDKDGNCSIGWYRQPDTEEIFDG